MSRFTEHARLWEVLDSPKARLIIERHAPGLLGHADIAAMSDVPLKTLADNPRLGATPDQYAAIIEDLRRPLSHVFPELRSRRSLDEVDRASFGPGPSPLDTPARHVALAPGDTAHPEAPVTRHLDGQWEMAHEGNERSRLTGAWDDAIPATVPGSVHTALVAAGRIPDPTFGTDQKLAKEQSTRTWWFRTEFAWDGAARTAKLVFDGVCNQCTVWLNGHLLGEHEGMFGGPCFELGALLESRNTLVVKLEPIPFLSTDPQPNNPANNRSWTRTVVFNNVYGWHYSNLPALGIWRSVRIEGVPAVSIADPFVSTANAEAGTVDLVVDFNSTATPWSGTLRVTVAPENFQGEGYSFERRVNADGPWSRRHFRFTLPDARLWWPVDLGEPNLYRMVASFVPEVEPGRQAIADRRETVFGVRTVAQAPLPEGPAPDLYNWTFVINGEPRFIKGANWCTLDPLMDFSRERYARFIDLAVQQHVQMFRPWGSGMPETDHFYDLCDRNGILVLQEWPTAWNSHETQPYDVLEETVRLNTRRIRNHPSLAMYGAGNESSHPFGAAIDMMGRLAVELDGTRAFHRAEPWGGSLHKHIYWSRNHLDHNLGLTAPFLGEFGLACSPPYESVQRYLPEEERSLWPPRADGAFAYHTPVFNTRDSISRLTQYASYFVPAGGTHGEYTVGSQLAQAVALRHTLERARTRWPDCAGALYYKINDNYPAASWATADWYGAPKIGHYAVQDAFAPLHACLLFRTLDFVGTPMQFPVYLLDDADTLAGHEWTVLVRAFGSDLAEIARVVFAGRDAIAAPARLGDFELEYGQTDSVPLLLVSEVRVGEVVADRTFYVANYENERGCLFTLPRTTVSHEVGAGRITVENTGAGAAVGLSVERPGHLDSFTAGDGCFWLDPAEKRTLDVNATEGLKLAGWNIADRTPRG